MPKFYISSGNIREIIDAKDAQKAMVKAVVLAVKKRGDEVFAGLMMHASEFGFSVPCEICGMEEKYCKTCKKYNKSNGACKQVKGCSICETCPDGQITSESIFMASQHILKLSNIPAPRIKQMLEHIEHMLDDISEADGEDYDEY
jgi:hypothetical protein